MGVRDGNPSEGPESTIATSIREKRAASSYTLWYHHPHECIAWSDNLLEITTGSAEHILDELSHFGLPSNFESPRCDLCIFRSHIVPMWEDPLHVRGGRWVVELKKNDIDLAWYRTLMAWFRSDADHWTPVTGIYLMIRHRVKIALWFADIIDRSQLNKLMKYWSEVIGSDLTGNATCINHSKA